eukprot:TRINITY_DN15139_c0_g1_i1.p1 TRINITY_DN15139_c0_g1~~TRINITY_DN15139_c0_g1_i1.p1  ORF type:complete len:1078 (+),score=171.59 TRINITY_DN15139_c0_g1_i1:75-3308(+)
MCRPRQCCAMAAVLASVSAQYVTSWVSSYRQWGLDGCDAGHIFLSNRHPEIRLWLSDDVSTNEEYACPTAGSTKNDEYGKTGVWVKKGPSLRATQLTVRFEAEEDDGTSCRRDSSDDCKFGTKCTISVDLRSAGGTSTCRDPSSASAKSGAEVIVTWTVVTETPTAAPTSPTAGPTSDPSASPIVSPPSVPPTPFPTGAPSTAVPSTPPTPPPSSSPTQTPSGAPSESPTQLPTESPSVAPTAPTMSPTVQPTMQPTRDSRQPTRAPLQPVTYCAVVSEGANCPGDDWEVTLDYCRSSECQHDVAAAAVTLQMLDAGGSSSGNITSAVDYTPVGPLITEVDHCTGLPGLPVAGGGHVLLQDVFHYPQEVAKYVLTNTLPDLPSRLVVGWQLVGLITGANVTERWEMLAEVLPNMTESETLLKDDSVTVDLGNTFLLRGLQVKVTHVQGDPSHDCRRRVLAAAASAAVGLCCCVTLLVLGVALGAVCGCGAMAARQKAIDPVEDAPWMGTEDHVCAQVLECYEELERRWRAKRGTVLDEAAALLKVAQGKDPVEVLRAHAVAEWREAAAAEKQLRVLPSAAMELLRRYSHEAQDTDHICGLPGAPKPFASYKASDPHHPKEAKAAWQGYKAQCCKDTGKPSINPALYADLNRAAREAAEGGSAAPEAWAKLTPILKQACLLIAAAAHASDPPLPPRRSKLPCPAGPAREQRWLRMLSLPDVVRDRFAGLRPGMCIAWSVGVASVTCNAKASSDFMYGGAGRCVLVRMTAPQSDARALSLGPASLYGGEGELLVALGTMFRVRNVSKGRMLTRYIQPTAATPVTARHLIDAIRNPLLIVDVEWLQSPQQWCDAARALCNDAMRDAWAVEDAYVQQKVFNFKDVAALCPGLCSTESPLVSTKAQPLRAQPLLQSEAAHGSGAGLVPRPGTPPREQVKGKKRGKRSKSGRQPKRRAATSGRNPSPPQRRGKHGPMLGPAGPFEPASFAPLPEAMITMLPCTPAKAAPSATLSYHAVPGGGPTSTESAPDLSQTMPPPRPPKVLQLRPLSTAPKAEPGALLHGSLRAVLGRPAAATHKAPEL